MSYRCEATSVAGFIQQVAVGYLARGYYFYVSGRIPAGKDPRKVDAKLIRKYGIDLSRGQRYRRKKAGLANVQYIRHERYFLLMATHGQHRFFEDEMRRIRDARRVPIKYAGYSVSHSNGRANVRMDRATYRQALADLTDLALRRSVEHMIIAFQGLPFEPYSPIRKQKLLQLRAVNRVRLRATLDPVPPQALRLRRRIYMPFSRD
jgi:hypothetical protein